MSFIPKKPKDTYVSSGIRLRASTLARVKAIVAETGQSKNAVLNYLIEEGIKVYDRYPLREVGEVISTHEPPAELGPTAPPAPPTRGRGR